ncbi:MAG: ABC-F family ATP-binding cassette domain-containing protein [Clostridia bacterium]|nr:ABC-F family ATP-binding cassette domain-containing protein [Clostridia bacterium]
MLLEASNISKSFGENLLFENGSFKVEAGQHIGLIGANGCGKTTLFKIISGEEAADGGFVIKGSGVTVGVLKQHACKDSTLSCYEEALSVFGELIDLETQIEDINLELETKSDNDLILKAQTLREKFELLGGLTYKSRTKAVLLGLGFGEKELELSVAKLSGGQKSKVEICKLLLSSPDIMLLDEPTNHLDIQSIQWLDGFIKASKSAVIVISHDRYFLDKIADKIISIEHGKINSYDGNYTKYLKVKEERELSVQREYDNKMREVHRIEGIIEQQKRWNREKNIKTAESKQKQIDRILKDLQIPESELPNMTLSFEAEGMCGNEALTALGLSCAFENKTLYENVNIKMQRGDRVFIIGKNGCGKSTLLKQLKNNLKFFGTGVTVGYFDQHGDNLDLDKTIFSQLRDDFPQKTDTQLRSALALFLFKGEDVFRTIRTLSGGERARVALCSLMLKKDNFLILDEPTNHLDLASREILENALSEYDGTILAVSHDRYFINKLSKGILYFRNKELLYLKGDYDKYVEELEASATTVKEKKTIGAGGLNYKQQKEEQARVRKLKTSIAKCEEEIEVLEKKQTEIEAQLSIPENAADYEKITALSRELDEIKTLLNEKMENWENLSEQVVNLL